MIIPDSVCIDMTASVLQLVVTKWFSYMQETVVPVFLKNTAWDAGTGECGKGFLKTW